MKILENGETKATEKTGRTGSLPWIGKGEYRTTVNIPVGTGFASLVFDGAMSEPEVFCDGEKIGEWKNGYNAFEVELPRTAGKAARVKLEKRRFGELLFVTATIVDEKGVLVPDADDELSFTCGKDLQFVAICNGDATSTESFIVPHMKAFHGQIVAVFRGTGDEVVPIMGGTN